MKTTPSEYHLPSSSQVTQKVFKNSHPNFTPAQPNEWNRSALEPFGNIYSNYKKPVNHEHTHELFSNSQINIYDDHQFNKSHLKNTLKASDADSNLILTNEELKNGLKVKKFREFSRVDFETENKSVSSKSMISESNRINTNRFEVYKPGQDTLPFSALLKFKEVSILNSEIKKTQLKPNQFISGFTDIGLELSQISRENQVFTSKKLDAVFKNGFQSITYHHPENPNITGPDNLNLPQQKSERETHPTIFPQNKQVQVELEVPCLGKFEGELINGCMNGYGLIWDDKGSLLYEGDFIDNAYEGLGVLYNNQKDLPSNELEWLFEESDFIEIEVFELFWEKYEGLFRKNKRHGNGYLYFKEQFVFFAEFNDDVIENGGYLFDKKKNTSVYLDKKGAHLKKRIN